ENINKIAKPYNEIINNMLSFSNNILEHLHTNYLTVAQSSAQNNSSFNALIDLAYGIGNEIIAITNDEELTSEQMQAKFTELSNNYNEKLYSFHKTTYMQMLAIANAKFVNVELLAKQSNKPEVQKMLEQAQIYLTLLNNTIKYNDPYSQYLNVVNYISNIERLTANINQMLSA
ncbi:hypothetical protein, partial [Mycoplasmopsis iners]